MMAKRQPRTDLRRLLELLSPVDRRVMAHLWRAPGAEVEALLAAMSDPTQIRAQWERLTERERAALERLIAEGGAMPVAIVQREYGGVREPGGFEHPRAYLDALRGPATPTERLFSLGFIFRAHDERGAIYRIPHDLLAHLPAVPPRARQLTVPPADAPRATIPATPDRVTPLVVALLVLAYNGELQTLDDGALNKASMARLARDVADPPDLRAVRREADWPLLAVARAAAVEAGLLRRGSDGELRPTAQALDWLRAPRAARMRQLLEGWRRSSLDDLTLLCGLRWQGGAPFTLDRAATRRALLDLLASLPIDAWLRIDDVVAAIRRVDPDFQRRDGRYDTWLLYDREDRLVSRWDDWDLVEGALIRAALRGPLHWLGLVDLDDAQDRLRWSPLGAHLIAGAEPPSEPPALPLIVQGTFEVLCPAEASLYARFQLSRIAELKQAGSIAVYLLTRGALLQAVERGIDVEAVLRFLREQSAGPLPPAVEYTLREWASQAGQVRLEHAVLLHAADPVMLTRLRADRSLDLAAAEQLGPTLLRLPPGADDEVAERLRRAGFGLRDERVDPHRPLDERDLRALVTAAFVYARVCTELGLSCDVTPAMLSRLARLVPPRHLDHASETARAVARLLESRFNSDQ